MEIRKLRKEEYPLLRFFLDSFWKKGHALVKSRSLLDFQHCQNGGYNYYACLDNGKIWSLIGFIPVGLYDSSIVISDAWGAIWKSRDDCPFKGVGLDLLEILLKNEAKDSFAAIGISPLARKIYKLYGMTISYLSQYYIVNELIQEPGIGRNLSVNRQSHPRDERWEIRKLYSLEGITDLAETYYPSKSIRYLVNRYQNHPIYRYFFWGIYNGGKLKSVWVLRRVTAGGASVMRIVDIYGKIESLPDLYHYIQNLIQEETCEYVDCLNYGIGSEAFRRIGFIEHDVNSDDEILPNYFEPFEQRNVKVEIAFVSKSKDYAAFKGDADQDRPNII